MFKIDARAAHRGWSTLKRYGLLGLIAGGVVVLFCAFAWALAFRSQSQTVLGWQQECAEYTLPADCVVYAQDPQEAARLLSKPDEYTSVHHSIDAKQPAAAHTAPCWYELYRATRPKWEPVLKELRDLEAAFIGEAPEPTTPILFLHERRSRAGTRWIVAVEVRPSSQEYPRASLAFMSSTRKVVHSPLLEGRTESGGGGNNEFDRTFTAGVNSQSLRFYAGQPDPDDASHFTIRYVTQGVPGTIDGWLKNDGGVSMLIRENDIKKNENGENGDIRK